jgi:hypothetical protein
MRRPALIEIDGKHYAWKDILQRRRDQVAAHQAARQARQLTLFDALHKDCRPAPERTASGRYRQPSLFTPPPETGK